MSDELNKDSLNIYQNELWTRKESYDLHLLEVD